MDSKDREDLLYSNGKRCEIDIEERYILKEIASHAQTRNNFLDIGCGSGEITFEVKKMGFNVIGIDFSENAIKLTKSKGIESYTQDLDKGLPFENDRFDIILAGDVMEHVFDPIFVFKEIKRVLKPKGILFATIPYDLNWKVRLKTVLGISYQEGVYRKYDQFKHHSFFSERMLRYMVKKAELNMKNLKYIVGRKHKKIIKNSLFRILSHAMIVEAIND